MLYGIIAAGDGSRLAAEGVKEPKPLVKVNGECLIDRLIRIFMANEPEGIAIICNEHMPEVVDHIRKRKAEEHLPIELVVKTTPSSMHSLWELMPYLHGPSIITTVDTIFDEKEFASYAHAFELDCLFRSMDIYMGLTKYIDDEKPLYADIDNVGHILGYYDERGHCDTVSAGIYGLNITVHHILQECIERGESRMRNFQRALIASHIPAYYCMFSKVLDIDHKDDIAKAEAFLRNN